MKKRKPSRRIILKADWEIQKLHAANQIVAEVLLMLRENLQQGITTYDLDRLAEEFIVAKSAVPAFKGYRGFPATACISINDEVVHGIPSPKRVINAGDLVSIDVGAVFDGYYGDAALSTVADGVNNPEAETLIKTTRDALYKGIEKVKKGRRLGDLCYAIQHHVESAGFEVVKQFVGHGIGRSLHEPPEVPNYGRPGTGPVLKKGMVIAIEPMVSAGSADVRVLSDGWTAVTADGSLSAHYEHSVALTEGGPLVLSELKQDS